jgi:lipopolysaccharide/colanic/teichoic acid biosynthesis glycosyltransferase
MQIAFLHGTHRDRRECGAIASRIVAAMSPRCPTCRVVENRCLDQVDARQRDILTGRADLPVMRTPKGAIAFISRAPGLAEEVCRESERHVSGQIAARCIAAGVGAAVSLANVDRAAEMSIPSTWLPAIIAFAGLMSLVTLCLVYRPRRPARPAGKSLGIIFTQAVKRSADIFLAMSLLVFLSPLWLLAAVAILVTQGRPIFYVSRRHISAHRAVPIFKFRTMVKDATAPKYRLNERFMRDGYLDIPLTCEVYTPVGRLLERLQLVETPQLLNILFHGMSFVGNRPLPAHNVANLRANFPQWSQRFASPAGITGIAQVVGRRNISPAERIALESLYSRVYLQGNVLKCDFKIVMATVWVVLFAKGIDLSQARKILLDCLIDDAKREHENPCEPAGMPASKND